MSIIGGFISSDREYKKDILFSKLKDFRFLSSDSGEDDEVTMIDIQSGVLFGKGKKNTRSLISASSNSTKSHMLSLGFFTDFLPDTSKIFKQNKIGAFVSSLFTMEGEFVIVCYDDESKMLHIVNDRFAARPLYYITAKEGFYFCTNLFLLLKISQHNIDFSPVGLFELFTFSHTIGSDTQVKGIERLTPATHLKISGKELSKSEYWKIRYEPDFELNPESYAKTVFEKFSEGVSKRSHLFNHGLLLLSGGLDSRMIAGALPENVDYTFLTFENSCDAVKEYDTAHEVAIALNRPHIKATCPEDVISTNAYNLTALTGGTVGVQHSIKSLQGYWPGYDITFGGGPGEILVGSYVPSIHHSNPKKMDYYLSQYTSLKNPDQFKLLFTKDIFYTYKEAFEILLKSSIEELPGQTAAHKISLWKMYHRQPAFIFSNPPHSHPYMTQIRPHLSYTYTDLILRLPAAWLFQRRFYQYMIYMCIPQLRHIINANTGKLLNGKIGKSKLSGFDYKIIALKRRTIEKIWSQKSNAPPPHRNGVKSGLALGDSRLLNDVREYLQSYDLLKNYFNVSNCIQYIDRITNNDQDMGFDRDIEKNISFLATITYFMHYIRNS